MAFPVVEATKTSITNPDATAHDISLPAGIVSGEKLVIIFAMDNFADPTGTPAGWTELSPPGQAVAGPNGDVRFRVYHRTADGGEGSTVSINTNLVSRSAHISLRISGWGSIEAAAESNGGSQSTSPDPPSLTPAGGAADYLWLAVAASGESNGLSYTAGPTNYTGFLNSDGTNSVAAGLAHRSLNASSEDPGVFTTDNSTSWVATTIAIGPASTVIEESVSESATLSDTPSDRVDAVESASEDVTLADGHTVAIEAAFDTEVLNLTDTVTDTVVPASQTVQESVAEALSLTDTPTEAATVGRAIAEALGLTDTESNVLTAQEAVADALSLTDTPSDVAQVIESISDSAALTDNVTEQAAGVAAESISEALSLTDSIDSPFFEISNWRVYADDGPIGSATPLAAENTGITIGPNGDVALGEAFRVRLQLNERDGGDPDPDTYEPVYSHNTNPIFGTVGFGGTWAQISDSTHFTNTDPVTVSILTPPGGSFENGEAYDEDPAPGDSQTSNEFTHDFARNGFTEIVLNVAVDGFGAPLETGDVIRFGMRDSAGTVFSTGTVVEIVGVSESVDESVNLSDSVDDRAVVVESLVESILFDDPVSTVSIVREAVAEMAAFTDEATDELAAALVQEILSDSEGFTDTVTDLVSAAIAQQESLSFAGSVAESHTAVEQIVEVMTLADPVSPSGGFGEARPISKAAIIRAAVRGFYR